MAGSFDDLEPADPSAQRVHDISTHPGDDTAAKVREFLHVHRVLSELHYLIGTERRLRLVSRSFHIIAAFDSGAADTHSAPVRIFDPEGKWVFNSASWR